MPHGSDSENHSIISSDSSVADHEDIGLMDTTLEHVQEGHRLENGRPPIQPENELERMTSTFEEQSTKLEAAFREIKATTNYFLNASRGPPGALALEVRNPETGRRIKLQNRGFIRLNTWLEASMDVLKQYLSLDGVEDEASEFDEGEEGLDGSDLNKKLFLMGCEGYEVLIGEVRYLTSTAGEEKDETTPLSNEASLIEELHRFLNWGSYTGIKEGQLAILINHPLYKDIRGVLERIIVTLITLSEECFIKELSFITGSLAGDGTRLSPWLEQTKKYLGRLPNKSFITQMYFASSVVPLNGEISTPTGSQKGEERVREPSNLDTIQEHSHSNNGVQESSTQGESQNQTDGVSNLHPALSPIASASSQGSLVDYLLSELKDCNDTLSPLSGVLEMAKAKLGTGTHSELYQAVRNNQHVEAPPPSNQHQYQTSGQHSPRIVIERNIASPPPPIPSPRKPSPPPKAHKARPRFASERPEPRQRFSDPIEKIEARKTSQSAQSTLWDQIQAAALTDIESLPSLLSNFEDIGFGLYCERKGVVLKGLGLDKWVELEILKCMWNNDSDLTRDSFREFSKKHLSKLGGFAPKPPPPNSGPSNSYSGSYNTTQQPPTGFGRSRNTTQQSPPEFGNGLNTTYQSPADFASLNPIRVSGQYTTTYYPQTAEILPNEAYGAMTQAPGFRQSDTIVEDFAQPRPNQPLIAAEAYNNYSVPGLSYSASVRRHPSGRSTNRPEAGRSRSHQRQPSPEILENRPQRPIAVSNIMDPLDPENTNGKRDTSPSGLYSDHMNYLRRSDINRRRETSSPAPYAEPGSPIHRQPHSTNIYHHSREREREDEREFERLRSRELERAERAERERAERIREKLEREREHERGNGSYYGLSRENSIKRPPYADVAASSRPLPGGHSRLPGETEKDNLLWKHSLPTPAASPYAAMPTPPPPPAPAPAPAPRLAPRPRSREGHPLQKTDSFPTSYG